MMFLLYLLVIIWILNKITHSRCNSKACLVGKVAIVTGGNKGIGYQTSLGLAARGCKVIIACRSNAESQKEEIIKETNNPNIITKKLDLGSFKSIRAFAKDINATESKIDILINNAALGGELHEVSEDGYSLSLQTNCLGPFLLTHLLLDKVKKSDSGRLIFLSSIAAWFDDFKLNLLNKYTTDDDRLKNPISIISAYRGYGTTKLLNLIMSNIFAEKLKKYGITSNAVNPGVVNTSIYDRASLALGQLIMSVFYVVTKLCLKTPEEGTQPTLKVAISNEYGKRTGTFAWDYVDFPAPPIAKNKEFCQKVWEKCETCVELTEDQKI